MVQRVLYRVSMMTWHIQFSLVPVHSISRASTLDHWKYKCNRENHPLGPQFHKLSLVTALDSNLSCFPLRTNNNLRRSVAVIVLSNLNHKISFEIMYLFATFTWYHNTARLILLRAFFSQIPTHKQINSDYIKSDSFFENWIHDHISLKTAHCVLLETPTDI